ncbi:hypothetical protein [Saccharothrix luteola]|uniref:hypothetical protein n=1 Tax=Saccharothrix luteola TaxID=2893018 RepID=UPI001E2A6DCD|nr:hypothetical protein [Saccharothrix luteola]MCC8245010.1 hypothetical protein [Saccharothrix luteola]
MWKEVFKIAVGDTASGIPGVAPVLRTLQSLLDSVDSAVAAQDKTALQSIVDADASATLNQASADLTLILAQFSDPARLLLLGQLMGSASRPRIDDPVNLIPPAVWTGRDWLHGKQTGRFVRALRKHAEASGDPRFIAYSRGWQVAFVALTAGSGFVNASVGSAYRTHWWRHRWVSNFIDTWVWGFYRTGATMSGDIPSPPFSDWAGVCVAGLQDKVNVTGVKIDHEAHAKAIADEQPIAQLLPADFVDYWLHAFVDVYGTVGTVGFTADSLQKAYTGLTAVLWFQTSGAVIGCNPLPGAPPFGTCADAGPPPWVDPTQVNPITGAPFLPQPPAPKVDPDVAEIVSGIILALLGVVAVFFGGFIVGAAALVAGIAVIIGGATEPDWNSLRCDVYWLKSYLSNGLTALHNLCVLGAVQHPYPRDLAVNELVLSFSGKEVPFASGAAVAKSAPIEGLRQPWDGALSTWTSRPTEPMEMPITAVFERPGLWPSAMVDDATANPSSHGVQDQPPTPWPGGMSEYFGPAVPAAIALLLADPDDLPNWNLDGDRGRGWLTWELASPYASPVNVVPES